LTKSEILIWLWKIITQSIFSTLRFTQISFDDCWSHIWWISTSSLTKFSIHATEYHFWDSSYNVLDRAISFYSFTVKTIIHDRRHRSQTTRMSQSKKIVLVAMQKTSNKKILQFATKEIDELRKFCSFMNLQVKMSLSYKKQVLSALNSCKILHFADHELIDSSNSFKSHLFLENWETKSLTITRLLETNLRKQTSFLVYLSTCEIDQIKRDELIDESLHLISAC
jgi:hypothetical protein